MESSVRRRPECTSTVDTKEDGHSDKYRSGGSGPKLHLEAHGAEAC